MSTATKSFLLSVYDATDYENNFLNSPHLSSVEIPTLSPRVPLFSSITVASCFTHKAQNVLDGQMVF